MNPWLLFGFTLALIAMMVNTQVIIGQFGGPIGGPFTGPVGGIGPVVGTAGFGGIGSGIIGLLVFGKSLSLSLSLSAAQPTK